MPATLATAITALWPERGLFVRRAWPGIATALAIHSDPIRELVRRLNSELTSLIGISSEQNVCENGSLASQMLACTRYCGFADVPSCHRGTNVPRGRYGFSGDLLQ